MAKVVRDHHNHGRRRGRSSVQSCFKNTLPAWEKEFCTKVGLFSWPKFLQAKKYIDIYPRVMMWNDEAGAEAFKAAKKRFKARYLGLPCKISIPSPDDCIDVVDWDSEVDPSLLVGMDRVSFDEDKDESKIYATHRVTRVTPIEAIQPTGWVLDADVDRDPVVGMIVGE